MIKKTNKFSKAMGGILLTGMLFIVSSSDLSAAQKQQLYFRPFESVSKAPYTVTMEKGTVYDLSSVIALETAENIIYLDQVSDEEYKSSKTGVATVTSEGILKAVKAGKTNISVKCKGRKIKLKVNVVKPHYTNDKYAKALNKSLAKFEKGIKDLTSFTAKNRLNKLKQRVQVSEAEKKFNENVTGNDVYYNGFYKNTLISPKYEAFQKADSAFFAYATALYPEMKANKDALKMKSITAKPEQVVIELNQKATADQVFGMLYRNLDDLSVADIGKGDRAEITVGIRTENSGSEYELRGELIRGNSRIVLVPYIKDGDTHQWSKTTLPAGEWKVWDDEWDEWIYETTFTVK